MTELKTIVFDWNFAALEQFVTAANSGRVTTEQPSWIKSPVGRISTQSLATDITTHLSESAGGHTGKIALGPNTASQFGNIRAQMSWIENNAWVRAVAGAVTNWEVLAVTYVISNNVIMPMAG
ncbi:hypothetical protein HDU76_006105 [Blyttiomyces sp. JEL0837]|nr:hypothetical protein HDU76_006105 [Blyttiomyces sp. JEL0837]